MMVLQPKNIPAELQAVAHWVNWKYETKNGKLTKVPLNPRTLGNAMSDNPKTWGSFEIAVSNVNNSNEIEGIGFVCSGNDSYTNLDFDKCRNPQTGEIESWAEDIIRKVNSYSEVSPSGTGIRIVVKAKLPQGNRNKKIGRIEFADSGKFFTLTGNVLDGYREIRKWDGAKLYDLLIGVAKDVQILDKAFASRNGEKLRSLWEGNWAGYPSQSEADMALASLLFFHTKDPEQTDKLFRKSGLMRPKWDEPHYSDGRTYGQELISRVSQGTETGDVCDWTEAKRTGNQIKTPFSQPIENTEFVSLSDIYTVQQTDKQDILTRLQPWNDIIDSNIKTEYLLDRLIPKGSITLEFGRGGIGKTTLTMDIGYAIAEGITFAELSTIKTPVYYIDFENPLSFVKDRASFIGRTDNMWFWHISNETPPPRLDSKEWVLYKDLPPGLLIIDSLRSSQLLDENSSKDMASILCRAKELREMGFTIVLLAHTPKGSDAIYKGSTAILDLSDHILGFQMVKDSGEDVVEFDPSQLFSFGTRIKTRYEPAQIFLNFDPSIKRFTKAEDPDCDNLRSLWNYLKTRETPPNQSEFREQGTKSIGVADAEMRRLISKGTGLCWTVQSGERNAKIYKPNSVCQFVRPYTQQTNKHPENPPDKQTQTYTEKILDTHEFVSLSEGLKQTNKQVEIPHCAEGPGKCDRCERLNGCMLTKKHRERCGGPFDDKA